MKAILIKYLFLPLFLSFVFAFQSSVLSAVLLDETFNYSVTNLAEESTWTEVVSGTVTQSRTVKDSVFTYSNLGGTYCLSGLGKMVVCYFSSGVSGNSNIIYKPFASPKISSGELYLSFLYQAGQVQTQTQSQLIGFIDGSTSFGPQIWVAKDGTTNRYKFGLTRGSTSSVDIQYGNSRHLSVDSVHLIVLKYDFTTKMASFYIDPTIASASEPSSEITDGATTTVRNQLNNVFLRVNGGNVARFKIGGVRISTSWQDAIARVTLLSNPLVGAASNIASTTITANWSPVENATGYDVYVYLKSKIINSTFVAGQAASSTIITGLSGGTPYTYTVKAKGNNGDSQESNPSSEFTTLEGITSVTCASKTVVYNGQPQTIDPPITSPYGKNVILTYNGVTTMPVNAGIYTVVASIVDSSYNASTTVTLTISKATLTISANNANKVVGAENPNFSGTITGFVNNETQSVLSSSVQFSCNATTASLVGIADIVPFGMSANNYNFNVVNGLLIIYSENSSKEVKLEADGEGATNELITSVLAPGFGTLAVEDAECAHPDFGRHITEVMDANLNRNVFEVNIHVTPDNDRCSSTVTDRERVEFKTYESSPEYMKGTLGETITYKWKFKLPVGFIPSTSFTHIHQIKPVGGTQDDPIFTFTPRKSNPNVLEIIHNNTTKLTSVPLALFEGIWVEVIEIINVGEQGTYSLLIKKVSDGSEIINYSNKNIMTIRNNNSFIRPKWGIYRKYAEGLRDEKVRFASFTVDDGTYTGSASTLNTPTLNQPLNISLNSFTANWSSVTNAVQYEVQLYLGEKLVTIKRVTSPNTSCIIDNLTDSTEYIYNVKAIGNGTTILNSNVSLSDSVMTIPSTNTNTNIRHTSASVEVYPNPIKNESINIKLPSNQKTQISIVDIHGILKYRKEVFTLHHVIEKEIIGKGVYFIIIILPFSSEVRKIIVE